MSTRTSLGRSSMMVPRTISPAAKRLLLCFRASSMVSIMTLGGTAEAWRVNYPAEAPLPNGPDDAEATEVEGQGVVLLSFLSLNEPPHSRRSGNRDDKRARAVCKDFFGVFDGSCRARFCAGRAYLNTTPH